MAILSWAREPPSFCRTRRDIRVPICVGRHGAGLRNEIPIDSPHERHLTLAPPVPEDGELIAGRYRIESELARGGIGVVYRARDERMDGRAIVIKVLLAQSVDSAWLQKKFEDERKALVRLNRPNIVAALDCGVLANGQSFLVFGLRRGLDVAGADAVLMSYGPYPLGRRRS